MSFHEVLQTLVSESGGGLAAALMGADGIPIDQVETTAAGDGEDVASLGAEFGRILDEARKAVDSVGGGALRELSLRTARYWILLRSVDDENYLVLVLDADGNAGKARYLMRRHLAALRDEL